VSNFKANADETSSSGAPRLSIPEMKHKPKIDGTIMKGVINYGRKE
jgi:hypothetical protein